MAFDLDDDPIIWRLFRELRVRRLPLGLDDYAALRRAMRQGFGLNSRAALRDLCVALWAKSRQEAEIVVARFDTLGLPDWTPSDVSPRQSPETGTAPTTTPETPAQPAVGTPAEPAVRVMDPAIVREVRRAGGLPAIGAEGVQWSDRSFVFAPQFPINYREAAQTWRRLRRPVRIGPPIELDVDQTLRRRANRGVVSAPVLVPRRRNVARLLVLVDRQGSMTPFHDFVDQLCLAVRAASLQHVAVHYFKNVPSSGADVRVLDRLSGQIAPTLDDVLGEIKPIDLGIVSGRADLQDALALGSVLDDMGPGAGVAIVSDAGAARGAYQPRRLLDTVAFLKGLRPRVSNVVWLNPIDRDRWRGTTAAQIARHSPMFSLTRSDLHAAVDVLRGRPLHLERPL